MPVVGLGKKYIKVINLNRTQRPAAKCVASYLLIENGDVSSPLFFRHTGLENNGDEGVEVVKLHRTI